MKLKLIPLLLSLCLVVLPAMLRADNKTVTEADASTPISINKGDTLTFSLQETSWNFNAVAGSFNDPTVPTNDSTAKLLSWASTDTHNTSSGASISIVFNAENSGQILLLFTKTGTDPFFKFTSALTFIVNIN